MIRHRVPEVMDQSSLDEQEHLYALWALNWVNRFLGIDRTMAACVRRIAGMGPLSVLDLGSGGGGFLGYLVDHNRATLNHRPIGLDRSKRALQHASLCQSPRIRWICGDALCIPLKDNSVDIVTCSLFLHHFDGPQVIRILTEARRVAAVGLVLADLTRSRLALMLTWLCTHLASRSVVFRHDGPASVRAAYTRKEMAALASRAGLENVPVQRQFPFRMMLIWGKPGASRCE